MVPAPLLSTGLAAIAISLGQLGLLLAVSTAIELVVAALFRLRGRGLLAVALVNVATNPLLNVIIFALLRGKLLSFSQLFSTPFSPSAVILLALEAGVVMVEWLLLIWALGRTGGSPRRLLALSAVMNLSSAVVFPVALAAFIAAVSFL
jgi:hypothetical protein